MSRSIRRIGIALIFLMIALLVNITFIQVFQGDRFRSQADNKRVLLEEYVRERGPILVDSEPIARSVDTGGELKYERIYPDGPMYVSATGFYSILYGATGLERTENDVLSGSSDLFFFDRIDQLISGRKPKGGAVTTTLNPAAQKVAWQGIKGTIGAVVAIEPATGRILALVQSPSFDPNKLSSHDTEAMRIYYNDLLNDPSEPMLNRPLVTTNPPGSTFKVVTAAAALESGRFTPSSLVPGPAVYDLPGSTKTLRNWTGADCGPKGMVSLIEALAQSCNTAFAWMGNELGADALRAQAERFGFDKAFEVPLRASTSEFPTNPDEPLTAYSAIGQYDVRATTLQMAMVAAGVGNGGVVMNPYLVQEIRGPDLAILKTFEPTEFGRALTPEHATQLQDMMVAVVDHGTATTLQGIVDANGNSVRVGAKTGTAQTSPDRPPVAWMIAMAPANNPTVAVAVMIQSPGEAEVSGNAIAGPVARSVLEAILQQ
jgi:peptidoglycan glycosyltransferase